MSLAVLPSSRERRVVLTHHTRWRRGTRDGRGARRLSPDGDWAAKRRDVGAAARDGAPPAHTDSRGDAAQARAERRPGPGGNPGAEPGPPPRLVRHPPDAHGRADSARTPGLRLGVTISGRSGAGAGSGGRSAGPVAIIGGGLAGASAAGALREHGFEGPIHLIGAEQQPPYNRPPLSKGYLRGQDRF